eukprot:SAG22_NODE_718_length_7670_cov_11.194690_5_plen_50_part_00
MQGHSTAMRYLARAYRDGRGVVPNAAEAARWDGQATAAGAAQIHRVDPE